MRVPNAKESLRSGYFLTMLIGVSLICPTSNVSIVNATVPKLRLNFGATYLRQFNVTSRGSIVTVVCFLSRVSSFLFIKTYSSIMSGMFHSRFFFFVVTNVLRRCTLCFYSHVPLQKVLV